MDRNFIMPARLASTAWEVVGSWVSYFLVTRSAKIMKIRIERLCDLKMHDNYGNKIQLHAAERGTLVMTYKWSRVRFQIRPSKITKSKKEASARTHCKAEKKPKFEYLNSAGITLSNDVGKTWLCEGVKKLWSSKDDPICTAGSETP